MKGYNHWSYAPYKPLLRNVGDIYICRIAPGKDYVHLEWLSTDKENYSIYFRRRNDENFVLAGKTLDNQFDIQNLDTDTDYEFYVVSDQKKSLVRLARTGETLGTVVNHLHPDDEAYSFSGRYLCSPSIVRHPDGFLLASMDLFAGDHPQNLTLIFRSDDDGKSWHYVSELMPCFWGKMFIHSGDLYMLACSTEYGDMLIGKSNDGGKTFSAPVTLLRGSNGKNKTEGVHKNPQNIITYNGRIYASFEWGTYGNMDYGHASLLMSCPVDCDLLNPENWTFTTPKIFENFTPETCCLPKGTVPIEGTLAISPEGKLLNIMRFASYYLPMTITESEIATNKTIADFAALAKKGCAIAYEADINDPEKSLTFSHLIALPAFSKFMIKHDSKSDKYYTLINRVTDLKAVRARNVLSLFVSDDLKQFEPVADIIDFSDGDSFKIGFQYVDFEISGDDIIFLSRTALNNAHNYHDANYSTFHRIKNFRNL
ncbi:MAG: exo-alpha-sialidase [Clostridia bacterium]|nr:exo-alpha-sialidase [Clostridia bacterium]